MPPATLVCTGHQGRGALCGQNALIRSVQYIYGPKEDADGNRRVLREAHFVIDCPTCGRRTQIEKYDEA
jgi:hypothetical protein